MTSIVRPRAVEYGFSRLTSTAERYRVPGAGAIWVSIESGDRLSVSDPEGGQSAEIAVLDASGRDDAAALSAKSDSQATGLRQVLRDAGEAAQSVIVELRRRRIDPRNLRAVIEDRVVTRIGSQQDREIDVRIIAATNRDLSAMVRAGAFRADLFYRVSVIALAVPALRDQPDLIDSLIDFYLHQMSVRTGRTIEISDDDRALLKRYEFPGNVRELANAIKQFAILSGTDSDRSIRSCLKALASTDQSVGALLTYVPPSRLRTLREEVACFENALIEHAVATLGSKRRAADALQVDISTIVRKLHRKTAS